MFPNLRTGGLGIELYVFLRPNPRRFATLAFRVQNTDPRDALMGASRKVQDQHVVMTVLQNAGPTAAAVQNSRDPEEGDLNIAARRTFLVLDHLVIGPALFKGTRCCPLGLNHSIGVPDR